LLVVNEKKMLYVRKNMTKKKAIAIFAF